MSTQNTQTGAGISVAHENDILVVGRDGQVVTQDDSEYLAEVEE